MEQTIKDRLKAVNDRIAAAAQRAGRPHSEITLIAVSKTKSPPLIQEAVDAGVRDLGENRVQEADEKIEKVEGVGVRWHLIGHLQSNKARRAVQLFDVIHSVDSIELAERLDRIASELDRRVKVLVQVKLGDEPSKSGASETEALQVIDALDSASTLQLDGLMGIAPLLDSPEESRPFFRQLKELMEKVNDGRPEDRRLKELSMGMSGDFEIAIEEGATMVRVGTAIFGSRS